MSLCILVKEFAAFDTAILFCEPAILAAGFIPVISPLKLRVGGGEMGRVLEAGTTFRGCS